MTTEAMPKNELALIPQLTLEQQIEQYSNAIADGFVPDKEDLGRALVLTKQIHELPEDDIYCDASNGHMLNNGVVEAFKKEADPSYWLMDAKAWKNAEKAMKAERLTDLTPAERKVARAYRTDAMQPDYQILQTYKGIVGKKMALSNELFGDMNMNQPGTHTNSVEQINSNVDAKASELQAKRKAVFSSVAKFASKKGSEHAAGPDIKKATGLSHDDIVALGYKNFDELKQDALGWKAAQEEKATRAAEAKERAEKYEAWQAERDEYHTKRQAADERVKAVEYRKKLLNGGELALKRNPKLAQKLYSEALAQVESEGASVGHLKPNNQPSTRNAEAEERQSSYAALLREHDAKMLRGSMSQENASVLLDSDLPELNRLIHAGEDKKLMEDYSSTPDEGKSEEEHFADVQAIFEQEPADYRSKEGLRARARRLMGKASNFIKTLPAIVYNRGYEVKHHAQEEGWTTRRRVMAGAILGVMAVGTAYATYKNVHYGHSAGATGTEHGNNPITANGSHGAQGGTDQLPHPQSGHGQEISDVARLHQGSTISGQVNEQLRHMGVHYNDHQLYEVVSKTLKHNGISYADAHHLPVGFQTHLLHPEQIKQILENSKS